MARSNLATIILYGGGVVITYLFLKSWGIIASSTTKSASIANNNQFNWTPLSEQQLKNLQTKTSPVDIYDDDAFETRTGRSKAGQYGFVSGTGH